MEILKALKETGKAIDEENLYNGKSGYVAWFKDELLYWFDKESHIRRHSLSHKEITGGNWQPYPDKSVIKPEKAGELWEWCKQYYHTEIDIRESNGIAFVGRSDRLIPDHTEIIHGQFGWTREFTPVDDENIERIVIKDVIWKKIPTSNGVVQYPDCPGPYLQNILSNIKREDILDKPPMKLIIEIPKEA